MGVPCSQNPKNAFFGGRTEAFWVLSAEAPIAYEDVTSLYLVVNSRMKYPVGHPTIIASGFLDVGEYFGFIKCAILPPENLFIPVLPMHAGPTKKLLFPLCRKCAESFQTKPCEHSAQERTMMGTWFSEEVKLAVKKGYMVQKIFSVWHFEQRSDKLFAEYMKTFYKLKLLSTKLPSMSVEEKLRFIDDVETREGMIIESVDDFVENPGLRQLTKLMLNNLWGRFGMTENLSKSKFCFDFEKLVEILSDKTLEVEAVRVVTTKAVQVVYRAATVDHLATSTDTNIFVAAATTAWARIHLYGELDKLGERAIYCDTDSVVYKKSSTASENLTLGNFLGEMTDELDEGDHIVEFVTGGPKNYGYLTKDKKCVVKVKGFTLNCTNAPVFCFENVKRVVLKGVFAEEDEENPCERVTRKPAKQRKLDNNALQKTFLAQHLSSELPSALSDKEGISVYNPWRILRTRKWDVMQAEEQKLYSFDFNKRIILSNLKTIPYGWR